MTMKQLQAENQRLRMALAVARDCLSAALAEAQPAVAPERTACASGCWQLTNRRERHFVEDGVIVGKLARSPSEGKWTAMVREREGGRGGYVFVGASGNESRAREMVEQAKKKAAK